MSEQVLKPRPRLGKYGSPLLNAGLVIIIFLVVSAFQSRNMLPTDRQPAPPLLGITLDGEPYDLSATPARPVLVYFFAPWCQICSASADNLARLRRWRDTADLEILTVALDWQNIEEVRSYAKEHDLNLPVVLGDGRIAQDWQIFAFPTYYVLDGQGRVARRDLGYSTQLGLWWRSWTVR